jgi:NitT/TauT family transport system substrate-binding protein
MQDGGSGRLCPRASFRGGRLLLAAMALAAVAALLAGCGGGDDESAGVGTGGSTSAVASKELTRVRLQLDWIPKEEYAFLYGGRQQGIFAKHGIDLQLNPGKGSVLAMQVLNGGAADMAYVNVASYVQALAQGAQGKAVYGIIQQDPQMIVSFKDNPVNSIRDLAGKSLITSSTEGFALYYPYLLEQNGVDPSSVQVRRVDSSAKGSTFASRRGDAVNLYQTQSIAPLEQQAGEEFVKLPSQDWQAGQLNVAENLIVLPEYLEQNRDVVKRMAAALAEAWEWAEQHPAQAAKAIQPMLANAPLDQVTEAVKASLALGHTEASRGRPTGWMAPEDWRNTITNLKRSGLAKAAGSPSQYYTNELIGR